MTGPRRRPVAPAVSVAIPTRNAGEQLAGVLSAVRAQEVEVEVDVVVIDSGSTDGSAELARDHGARVEVIAPESFSHGGTRNRLMEASRGEHVAFLTQDAEPASPRWLAELLAGFASAPDVALVTGPYLPRPGAPPMVRRELEEWFARMSPVVRRPGGRPDPGPDGYFSSANGAVARWAWEQVPFREVPYAEDRLLAADMLARGWARAYRPGAAVLHSHALRALGAGAKGDRRGPRASGDLRPCSARQPAGRTSRGRATPPLRRALGS